MKYSANFHFAGCLPEGDGPTLHDSPAEAWRNLLEIMGDDRWAPDDENDPEGPASMTSIALQMERMEDENREGTLHTLDGVYEVEWAGDWEVQEISEEPEPKVFDRGAALVERMKPLLEKKNREVIVPDTTATKAKKF